MSIFGQSLGALKSMAKKVQFVSFDVVQFQDKEMRSHWYKYDAIDLYYFEKSNHDLVKIHVNVFGQVVEWNRFDGARTGVMLEEEKAGEVIEVLQYDSRPNSKALAQCLLVLENAFQIDEGARKKMILCVKNEHSVSTWQKLKNFIRLTDLRRSIKKRAWSKRV
jgi:hypothetical protein